MRTSISPLCLGNPLTFYPEIHLRDLDGMSILLLSSIGFWANTHWEKTPNAKYLLQVEADSFAELAYNSEYPVFSSSYYIRRGETIPGRINVAIADPECHTDFYLVCLASEKKNIRNCLTVSMKIQFCDKSANKRYICDVEADTAKLYISVYKAKPGVKITPGFASPAGLYAEYNLPETLGLHSISNSNTTKSGFVKANIST